MKKIALLLISTSAFFAACNSEKAADSTADSNQIIAEDTTFTATEPKSASNCYAYTKNRDTAALELRINGEELTGDLSYTLFEKDSNKGTIAGEVKGDTIIAEYTFDSEGMRSVREVVFLKKDGKLYEGFGPVEEKGGKTLFTNRSLLKFENSIVFSPADCK